MLTTHNEAIYTRAQFDGINIHYLPVNYNNQMGFIKRVWSYIKFVRLAKRYSKNIKNIDRHTFQVLGSRWA